MIDWIDDSFVAESLSVPFLGMKWPSTSPAPGFMTPLENSVVGYPYLRFLLMAHVRNKEEYMVN